MSRAGLRPSLGWLWLDVVEADCSVGAGRCRRPWEDKAKGQDWMGGTIMPMASTQPTSLQCMLPRVWTQRGPSTVDRRRGLEGGVV
jgi:hypothetical protein